jgi:hypothetical protein
MIWMAMSSKEVSNVYVHQSNQVVDQETYLKECIDKRLLLFIKEHLSHGNYLFWPDLARAHYSNVVQERLKEKKTYHLFFVLIIHQTCLELVQLKLFGPYLNERCMRISGTQRT